MSRTPEQREAIDTPARRVCVDAGAGSGKTRVLIDRLLRLLDPAGGNVPFDRIVAITFTNKAAAEMRSRLREAAHERAIEGGTAGYFWRDLERKLDAARIDTIDAFCLKLLKEHAVALGLDPEFTIPDEAAETILRGEVIVTTLRGLLEQDDPHAFALITEFGLYALKEMLDGMLTQRESTETAIAEWSGLAPEAIVDKARAVTEAIFRERVFTENNRRTLEEAHFTLSELTALCKDPQDIMAMQHKAALKGIDQALAADTVAAFAAARPAFWAYPLNRGSNTAWSDKNAKKVVIAVVKTVRAIFEGIKIPEENPEITQRSAALVHALMAVFEAAVAAMDAEKARRQAFYFDDIMRRTVAVLQEDAALRRQVAASIDHLLIDEFQDTDPRQLVIANLLHGETHGPSLFIVGDAKQSIYRFRGAEVSVFAEAREAAGGADGRQIAMNRNHRTVPEVLGFVNDFFEGSGALAAVEQPYRPMDIWRPVANEPRVEFLQPVLDEKSAAADGREAEGVLIAARLKRMCELEPVTIGDAPHARRALYGDAAILVRTLNDVLPYERALVDAGVPYYIVAGKGFYEQQEVIDLRNLLAVVADPFDEVSLAGFLRSPIGGLSDDALLALCERNRTLSRAFAHGAAPDGFGEESAWTRARALVAELGKESQRPLADFVALALARSGYEAMLMGLRLGESRVANVRKVADLASAFEDIEGASLPRFIAYMDEVAAKEIQEGEAGLQREGANAVAIMTIHKSKGLEFPIVCLPDLGRQLRRPETTREVVHRQHGIALKPTGDDGEPATDWLHFALSTLREEEEDAERARILYVAMTRAQDWLLLGAGVNGSGATWLDMLEGQFNFLSRAHGDVVTGGNWQAVVRRELSAAESGAAEDAAGTVVDAKAAQRLAEPIERAAPHGRTVSVSALLNAMEGRVGFEDEAHEPRTGADDPLMDGKTRGSIVHGFLERWDLGGEPAEAVDAVLKEDFPMPVTDRFRQALIAVAEFVRGSELAEPMRDAATRHELDFAFRLGDDAVVMGKFDAVLPDGTLIDWKTGKFHEGTHARYERQLQLYAAAAAALGHPPPAAKVVYVEAGRIEPVDISGDAIAATLERAHAALASIRSAGMAVMGDA